MKRIFLFIVLFAVAAGMSAQSELQRLLTTYTESVRLPYYKECKRYDDRIPKSIDDVALDGVWLTVKYVVHNSPVADIDWGKYNNYTVRVDLSKTSITRINNEIEFVCKDGIEMTEENGETGKKHPFLIEKWTIKCNDSPLCHKLFEAMREFETLEVSEPQKGKALSSSKAENQMWSSWSVAGRSLGGKLAQPKCSVTQHGVIVVNIRVDASGKVVDAIIGTGSTISSPSMREAAIEAAKQNEFSSGNSMAVGSITYRF